jgi:ribosomal protein S18 acetylase RimI-like enzyme
VTHATRRAAIAFAARRPYENAFIQWVLEGGHGPDASDEIVLHRDSSGAITGAIYFGTQLVLAADDDATVDAFAAETRRHPGLRSFVGPRTCVGRLWEQVRGWHRPPVLVRTNQPIYVLFPAALLASVNFETEAEVRQATLADADRVIENSAEMMLGELGYDPRTAHATFGAGVRRAIARGQWWVWVKNNELRFQLNVGARTRETAQLQGVWTPPAQRKRGYAFAALSQIAQRLLLENPTLSLYVNDFNTDAIGLYERIGFVREGTMSTLLFA